MPNPNLAFAAALASVFADRGITDVCISPGSRNTPLIAGFAGEERLRAWPLLDERSAGFFAVGLAKATGRPVALACTSGTAAVEYHPAVVEASQSHVPLLVLTADRPEDLRGIGSPQTIDQVDLYGTSVRFFADIAPPPVASDTGASATALANEAWASATGAPPGPVHLNLQFREPLIDPDDVPPRVGSTPDPAITGAPHPSLDSLSASLSQRRGVIVAGQSVDPDLAPAVALLAARTGFPVFADPLSGLRHGPHTTDDVLASGDALAAAGALAALSPDAVIRLGPVPTSKPVWSWLQSNGDVAQILIDVEPRDATSSAATVVQHPAAATIRLLAESGLEPAPDDWTGRWRRLDQTATATLDQAINELAFPNEPAIARTVVDHVPVGACLTLGSSMPIRDVDTYGGKSQKPLTIFGNRGANGIDGVVSAALGAAASGQNTVALVGDVSLFHDLNALGTAVQLALPVTVVVVHNDGGGIFHLLPQGEPGVMGADVFERYLATPHHTDFVAAATALGHIAYEVAQADELADLLRVPAREPRLIQIRTVRHDRRRQHDLVGEKVRAALAREL